MPVTLFGEFILLFQMACVIFLFTYLFAKSRFYTLILEHRASVAVQVFLAIVFGLLSVYGMNTGITFYTANVNIRDFGPLAAGLACGPYVGLGAGLIGFVYRLSVGGTNVYAVALGPFIAGITGGLVYWYHNRELVPARTALLVALGVEVFVSVLALAVRYLAGDSVQAIMTVAVNVALPMIIMTTLTVGIFCIILHNEINDRRTREAKLHLEVEVESRKNLEQIVNAIPDPVFVKNREHCWILVNDGFCRMFARSREELIGKTTLDFFPEDESQQFFADDEAVLSTRRPHERETRLTNANGQEFVILLKKTYFSDTSRQEYIVGVVRDVTERKRIEESVQNLNRKLTMLSSITRHDILNQLMVLMGYLQLLQKNIHEPEKIQESLDRATRAAQTIERQIVFTRDYQGLGDTVPAWRNLSHILASAKSQLPAAKDIVFTIDLPRMEIFADALIEKVFYNLMENSIRHGGHVTALEFRFEEDPAGGTIIFTDNGTGILPQDKNRLFARGFGKNTGLGLFLSREILAITGITIDETGEPGKGVRFVIRIPKGGFRMLSDDTALPGNSGGK